MTDSAPNPTPGEAKSSKKRKWPWIVGAVVALLVVIGIASGGGDEPSESKGDRQTSADSGTADADQAIEADTEPGVGVPVRDGKFEFTVTSIDRSATAGDPTNEFLQEQATGEFVNVHLTVTNIGDEAQDFFASNQKLIVDGKKFDAASILGLPGDMSGINPGLSIETVVPFDVPPGAQPDAVELHDSAFSGGVKVALK